jgi:hypothetical protein
VEGPVYAKARRWGRQAMVSRELMSFVGLTAVLFSGKNGKRQGKIFTIKMKVCTHMAPIMCQVLLLINSLQPSNKPFEYPCFTYKETEAQVGHTTRKWQSQDLNPGRRLCSWNFILFTCDIRT